MKVSLTILVALFISGCSSLRPVVDQTRYFVLSPAPEPQPFASPGTIGISHIELPEYLRKREMAWRSGGQEIRYALDLQWAEPLDKMIGRVLASDLGALVAPNFRRTEVQTELSVSFTHFESDETGRVTVEANWTIRCSSGRIARGHAKLSSQGPVLMKDPAGAAVELSKVLTEFGAKILETIQITP